MERRWLGWALMVAMAAGCSDKEEGVGAWLDAGTSVDDAASEAADAASAEADGAADAEDAAPPALSDAASDAAAPEDAAAQLDATHDTGVGLDAASAGDSSADASDASTRDASTSDAGTADASGDAEVTREAYCSGQGSVIKVPGATAGSTRDLCTGTVARQRFKNALCVCENADIKGYLATGSFSASQDAPGTFTKSGGSVGVNGRFGGLISAGDTEVGGSLRLYGGATFGGYVDVYGDYEANGNVDIAGYLKVARDAKLRQGLLLLGHANIGRDVYTRPGTWDPPLWSFIGGERIVQEFALDKPCACEPEDLLDVDAIVRDGKQRNDNQNPAVDLDPAALTRLDFARRLELPCGRFYVDEISGVGDLHLVINGRTALFVGGDVSTIGHFDIELGPQGELDLFIAGDLMQVGYGQFGDVNRPSGVRVYVGGDGDLFFRGYQPVGANIYAPRSHLHSDGFIDAKGSLFVRSLYDNGYLKVNYDRDVLDLGDDDACNPPKPPPPPVEPPPVEPPPVDPPPPNPPECAGTCNEMCGQRSCVDGVCQGCSVDSDCCAPLVCYPDGRCGPLLF